MKHLIFCIFDQKAKAHLPPWTLPTIAMAERTFADCINSESHAFGRHPADYTLIQSGEWDDNSNKYTLLDLPNVVGTGIQYLTQPTDTGQIDAFSQNPETPIGDESPILASTKS